MAIIVSVPAKAECASKRGALFAWLVCCCIGTSVLQAQVAPRDSVRAPRDTAVRQAAPPVNAASTPRSAAQAARERVTPPITPRRAFIYSAVLPGFGQSRLDRGSSGALFAAVELAGVVMLRRSSTDLREARRFRNDTLPTTFVVGTDGTVTPAENVLGRYNADLVRTRRLHVEDWLAVLAFNHLFSGADAFVSAQLWEIPVRLSAAPTTRGPMFVASLRF